MQISCSCWEQHSTSLVYGAQHSRMECACRVSEGLHYETSMVSSTWLHYCKAYENSGQSEHGWQMGISLQNSHFPCFILWVSYFKSLVPCVSHDSSISLKEKWQSILIILHSNSQQVNSWGSYSLKSLVPLLWWPLNSIRQLPCHCTMTSYGICCHTTTPTTSS